MSSAPTPTPTKATTTFRVPSTIADRNNADVFDTIGFVVKGLLDVEKVKSSFARLQERWPVLGGRCFKDGKKGLMYYQYTVPPTTTASLTFGSHPTIPLSSLSFIPIIPSTHPSTCPLLLPPVPSTAKAHFLPPGGLPSNKDVRSGKEPMLHVHLTRLEDDGVTLLGFTFWHVFMDGKGADEVLNAWVSLLGEGEGEGGVAGGDAVGEVDEGREDIEKVETGPNGKTITFKDPLLYLYPSTETTKSAKRTTSRIIGTIPKYWNLFSMSQTLAFFARFKWDRFLHPKAEHFMIHFPAEFLKATKDEAMEKIKAGEAASGEKEKVEGGAAAAAEKKWVSTGDLLTAWLVHAITSTESSTSKRRNQIPLIANFRSQFPNSPSWSPLSPTNTKPYFHNMFTAITPPPFSDADLKRQSLADVALIFRRTLNECFGKDSSNVAPGVNAASDAGVEEEGANRLTYSEKLIRWGLAREMGKVFPPTLPFSDRILLGPLGWKGFTTFLDDPYIDLVVVSSWTGFSFGKLDFSPLISDPTPSTTMTTPKPPSVKVVETTATGHIAHVDTWRNGSETIWIEHMVTIDAGNGINGKVVLKKARMGKGVIAGLKRATRGGEVDGAGVEGGKGKGTGEGGVEEGGR